MQQREVATLEAELVDKQRALTDSLLRLKLQRTPRRQDWAQLSVAPAGAGAGAAPAAAAAGEAAGEAAGPEPHSEAS